MQLRGFVQGTLLQHACRGYVDAVAASTKHQQPPGPDAETASRLQPLRLWLALPTVALLANTRYRASPGHRPALLSTRYSHRVPRAMRVALEGGHLLVLDRDFSIRGLQCLPSAVSWLLRVVHPSSDADVEGCVFLPRSRRALPG
jgi:hypothetical protein